jgi:hypothetical protein
MVCFASQRNLGQSEDTSCYLIFLQKSNRGRERSSLLLTHHSHLPFRKSEVADVTYKSHKALLSFLPHIQPKQLGSKKRRLKVESKEAAVVDGLHLEGHGHVSYGNLFPSAFLPFSGS